MDVARGDHGVGFIVRLFPAFRFPAVGRDAVAEGAAEHEDDVDEADDEHGLHDADGGVGAEVLHEEVGEQ